MKRVRISDIAKAAGVSNATVSYALSDAGRVSKETRDRILAIADRMGFIRDIKAAQLRTGQSSLIGVVLNTIVNPFFSELVSSLETAAYNAGYLTILSTAQNDPVRQRELLSSMIAQGVAGVVVSPVHVTGAELLSATVRRAIPTVVCVRDVPGSGAVFVGSDEVQSGYLAARHLIENGHRGFHFIGGYPETTTWRGRREGILRALAEAGLPAEAAVFCPGTLLPEFAYSEIAGARAERRLGSAVICFNDDQCTGAYRAARDLGLEIGSNLSVVGFDNVQQAESLSPGLTSVDIHPDRIGRISAEIIVEMLKSGNARANPVVLEPILVRRGSVARLA